LSVCPMEDESFPPGLLGRLSAACLSSLTYQVLSHNLPILMISSPPSPMLHQVCLQIHPSSLFHRWVLCCHKLTLPWLGCIKNKRFKGPQAGWHVTLESPGRLGKNGKAQTACMFCSPHGMWLVPATSTGNIWGLTGKSPSWGERRP